MPDSESKRRWDKENIWLVAIKFHRKYDADIVQYLEAHNDEKQTLIKLALREYMTSHQ